MSDDFKEENGDNQEPSFADLLDSYSVGMTDDISEGDKITGKIISMGRDSLFIDTGTKIDGVVDKKELLDENGELPYAVGDTVELYVVSSKENEILLSRAMSGAGGLALLTTAWETGTPVEGKVKAVVKGGFHVDIMEKRAFCPISQMDVKFVEDPEVFVGETAPFLISRIEEGGKNIVVSRRKLLEMELAEARKAFMSDLSEGDIVEGTVIKLMPYGAFVELIPGVEGMAHISELSWSRLEKPEEAVAKGDRIRVKVLSIGEQEGNKPPRLSLSFKQVKQDPWELVGDRFHVGDNLTGKVTRCLNFGAFVEIAEGTEGLVHISEMSYTKRVLRPEEVVTPGETVAVVVKAIDLEKKRISLSIRDSLGDPWDLVDEKYKLGAAVSGTVEKKETFGYFITLEPGVTALLPKSKISGAEDPSAIEKLKQGDAVTLFVEAVNREDRKITLAPPGSGEGKEDWKKFAEKTESSMGGFGELLQQAMKDKK